MNQQILISIPENEFWDRTREIFRETIIETRPAEHARRDKNTGPDYLTRSEAADLLRITKSTLHTWTKSGVIKPRRIGGRVLYNRVNLLKIIEGENLKFQRRAK